MEDHIASNFPPDAVATLFAGPDFLEARLRKAGVYAPSKTDLAEELMRVFRTFRNKASWLHPRGACPRRASRRFEFIVAVEFAPLPNAEGGWLHIHALLWGLHQIPFEDLGNLWRSTTGIRDPREPRIEPFRPGGGAVRYCLKSLFSHQDLVTISNKATFVYLQDLSSATPRSEEPDLAGVFPHESAGQVCEEPQGAGPDTAADVDDEWPGFTENESLLRDVIDGEIRRRSSWNRELWEARRDGFLMNAAFRPSEPLIDIVFSLLDIALERRPGDDARYNDRITQIYRRLEAHGIDAVDRIQRLRRDILVHEMILGKPLPRTRKIASGEQTGCPCPLG